MAEVTYEVEQYARRRFTRVVKGKPATPVVEDYVWNRALFTGPDAEAQARDRVAYLWRVSMDPDTMPPRGMPRSTRVVLIKREVVDVVTPELPPPLPLGHYKQPKNRWTSAVSR